MKQVDMPMLDFATVMASSIHDMKNSLGAVLGGLDELQTEMQATASGNRQMDALKHQSRRLNCQLMQLLSIYKLQQDLYTPNIQSWSLDELLEDVVAENQGLLAAKEIRLTFSAKPDLLAYFDRELIVGVLENALNNGFRYARSHMHLSADIWHYPEGDGVVIAIADDGPGYPPAMLVRPGEVANILQFKQGRTGLGLYFCALVADLHRKQGRHGEVLCNNDGLAGGGRFSLRLP